MTDSRCEDTCKAYEELRLTACEGCSGKRTSIDPTNRWSLTPLTHAEVRELPDEVIERFCR